MKKFWKVLQGIGLATAGTILAQPDIITGSFSSATQTKVVGVIALINAILPAIKEPKKKPATPKAEKE